MAALIIEKLQSPDYLKNVYKDTCKLKLDLQIKHKLYVKILVFLSKNLEKRDWIDKTDYKVLQTLTVKICEEVSDLSNELYHNFLYSVCYIFRQLIKKGFCQNDASFLKLIFLNSNLKLTSKHTKYYNSLFGDFMSNFIAENVNKEEITNHLECLKQCVEKFMKNTDAIFLYKDFLPWFIRKSIQIFNEKVPEDLDEVLNILFQVIPKLNEEDEKKIRDETIAIEISKNLFYMLTSLIQMSKSNKSALTIFKYYKKIFILNKTCNFLFEKISGAFNLFDNLARKTSINLNQIASDLCSSIENIENNSDVYYYFIGAIRYMLNYKLDLIQQDKWDGYVPLDLQLSLMKLVLVLAKAFKNYKLQSVKCENCPFKSGIHDSTFTASCGRKIMKKCDLKRIIKSEMPELIIELFKLETDCFITLYENQCPRWESAWSTSKTSFHCDAFDLYSANLTEDSIKFFQIYFAAHTKIYKAVDRTIDLNSFLSGTFNMAICHLDRSEFKESLEKNYLCMILSFMYDHKNYVEKTKKSLIRIKAKITEKIPKENKPIEDNSVCDKMKSLQILNSWCVSKEFEDFFKRLFQNVDFGDLLLLELETYNTFWFVTDIVAEICKSMQDLYEYNKKSNTGNYDECALLVIMGKAITLFNTHVNKLRNPKIISFIRFTSEKYESFMFRNKNKLEPKNEICLKLLFATIQKTLYALNFYERIDADKFSSLPTKMKEKKINLTPVHPDDTCDIESTHICLNISVENDVVQPLFKAIDIWREILDSGEKGILNYYADEKDVYINEILDTMESVARILFLRGFDIHTFKTMDILLSFAKILDKKLIMIRAIGFIIEYAHSQNDATSKLIDRANTLTMELLKSQLEACDLETIYCYMLNLSVYYYNCNLREKGLITLRYVQNKMLDRISNVKDVHLAFVKLLSVQSLYIYENKTKMLNDKVTYFTSTMNTFKVCYELVKMAGHLKWQDAFIIHSWIESGLHAGRTALMLGLSRRCRSILKSLTDSVQRLLLPRVTIKILILLANADLATESLDDCKVKLDSINYILEENSSKEMTKVNSSKEVDLQLGSGCKKIEKCESFAIDSMNQFEVVLDASIRTNRFNNGDGSPVFQSSPFIMPSFIDHHRKCDCGKCNSLMMFSLTLGVLQLKANLFWRTGEPAVAQTFINGGLRVIQHLGARLKHVYDFTKRFENFQFDSINNYSLHKSFIAEKCQFLSNVCLFLIQDGKIDKAEALNDQIIEMFPLLPYDSFVLMQSVYEQKIFFSQSRIFCESHEKQDLMEDLDTDFNSKLLLTPQKKKSDEQCFKTPMAKNPKPPQIKAKRVRGKNLFDDSEKEYPEIKMPIIKINLDDDSDNDSAPVKSDPVKKDDVGIIRTPAPKSKVLKKTTPVKPNMEEQPKSQSSTKQSHNRGKKKVFPVSSSVSPSSKAEERVTRSSSLKKSDDTKEKPKKFFKTRDLQNGTDLNNKKWKL